MYQDIQQSRHWEVGMNRQVRRSRYDRRTPKHRYQVLLWIQEQIIMLHWKKKVSNGTYGFCRAGRYSKRYRIYRRNL